MASLSSFRFLLGGLAVIAILGCLSALRLQHALEHADPLSHPGGIEERRPTARALPSAEARAPPSSINRVLAPLSSAECTNDTAYTLGDIVRDQLNDKYEEYRYRYPRSIATEYLTSG